MVLVFVQKNCGVMLAPQSLIRIRGSKSVHGKSGTDVSALSGGPTSLLLSIARERPHIAPPFLPFSPIHCFVALRHDTGTLVPMPCISVVRCSRHVGRGEGGTERSLLVLCRTTENSTTQRKDYCLLMKIRYVLLARDSATLSWFWG